MTIARVSGHDAKGQTTATGHAQYPGAPTPGNLLICTTWTAVTTAVTLSQSGWTLMQETLAGAFNLSRWAKIADGTEAGTFVDVVGGSGVTKVHLYEYGGVTPPSGSLLKLVDGGSITGSQTSAATGTTPSVSTLDPAALVFATLGTAGAVTAPSVSAPFTLLQVDASAIRMFDAEYIPGAAGSYAATFSWTTSSAFKDGIIAFRATPSELLFFYNL